MKTSISKLVKDSVESLYDADLIDITTMREFEALQLKPVKQYTARQIKKLRLACKVSQKVLALILNVSQSSVKQWEMGERKPSGSALKLLNLIDQRGINAVI